MWEKKPLVHKAPVRAKSVKVKVKTKPERIFIRFDDKADKKVKAEMIDKLIDEVVDDDKVRDLEQFDARGLGSQVGLTKI